VTALISSLLVAVPLVGFGFACGIAWERLAAVEQSRHLSHHHRRTRPRSHVRVLAPEEKA
jgi:hypothetical protein